MNNSYNTMTHNHQLRVHIDVIKGRWIEGEPTILTSPEYAYYYAKNVIRGRWIEGEPIILTDPQWSYLYSKYVIKGRWEEAEEIIAQSNHWWCEYTHSYVI